MKTVLITGISRGIGKAIADRFLAEGWEVFGTSISGEVDFSSENLPIFQLDLSVPMSIEACVQKISEQNKKIDILINNAGALFDEEEIVVVVDKLRKTLEVNLIGTIDFTERVIPLLSSDAHIINISSSAGSLAEALYESHELGHYPSYKISKTALNMYTRTLALRFKDEKKIVSSVHPGWVKTEMGGENAEITPEVAGKNIFDFAITRPESGGFWHDGKIMPW